MSIHPFEKAKLGTAPFRCIGTRQNWFVMADGTRNPGGHCHFCFTGILDEFVIKSSDGKTFVVGCDCVERVGDVADFKKERLQLARAKREVGATARREASKAAWEAKKATWATERAERDAAHKVAWWNENKDLGDELLAYSGKNEFLLSLQGTLSAHGSISPRATVVAAEALKREADKEEARLNSRFVGRISERVRDVKARVTFSRTIGYSNFGGRTTLRTLVKLQTETNDQLVWFTDCNYQAEDEFSSITFTVKSHEVYEGMKQTVVNRVVFN